jgi:hypothetical protein
MTMHITKTLLALSLVTAFAVGVPTPAYSQYIPPVDGTYLGDLDHGMEWISWLRGISKVDSANRLGIKKKELKHVFGHGIVYNNDRFVNDNFVLEADGYYYAKPGCELSVNKEFDQIVFKGVGEYFLRSPSGYGTQVRGKLAFVINPYGEFGCIRDVVMTSKDKFINAQLVPDNFENIGRYKFTGVTTKRAKNVVENIIAEFGATAVLEGKLDQISIYENRCTVSVGDVATGKIRLAINNEKKEFIAPVPKEQSQGPARQGIQIGKDWLSAKPVQIEWGEFDITAKPEEEKAVAEVKK